MNYANNCNKENGNYDQNSRGDNNDIIWKWHW